MKIYEIDYSFEHEYELPEGILPEEVDDEERYEYVSANMFIGAPDFDTAWDWATDMLEQVFPPIDGISQYELRGVKEIQGMDILNWPGEEDPCNCPFCRAERMADEDLMHFECHNCHHEIKIADGDWEAICCPECGEQIYRDGLLNTGGGKFKVIKVSNKED